MNRLEHDASDYSCTCKWPKQDIVDKDVYHSLIINTGDHSKCICGACTINPNTCPEIKLDSDQRLRWETERREYIFYLMYDVDYDYHGGIYYPPL